MFWNKMLHKRNKLNKGVNDVTLLDIPEEIVRNKGVKRVTLLDIPEEIVRYIAKYLMMEDVIHLSMTCQILYHMLSGAKYLKFLVRPGQILFECKKINIEIDKSFRPYWSYYLYFDCPPFTSHIFMATISGKILVDEDIEEENGLGKLNILIQLLRPQRGSKESTVIARHQTTKLLNINPERMESMVLFLTIEDTIINMIQPGDYFRFVKHVKVMDFMVQTRGIRNRPTITAQKGDINALTQDSSVTGMLHGKNESFANIIAMFKKQDEIQMLKKPDENSENVMKYENKLIERIPKNVSPRT